MVLPTVVTPKRLAVPMTTATPTAMPAVISSTSIPRAPAVTK